MNTPAAQSSGKDCDGEKKVHMTDQAAAKIQRRIQPEVLKRDEPLLWSPGTGTAVWNMFCAAMAEPFDSPLVLLRNQVRRRSGVGRRG